MFLSGGIRLLTDHYPAPSSARRSEEPEGCLMPYPEVGLCETALWTIVASCRWTVTVSLDDDVRESCSICSAGALARDAELLALQPQHANHVIFCSFCRTLSVWHRGAERE